MLLAQAAPELSIPDLGSLAVYGPLGILFAVFIYFLMRYGSRWFEGQITMMSVMTECSKDIKDNIQALSENTKEHAKIPLMLGHIAEAAKAATDNSEVKRHLDRAIDLRDNHV